MAEHCHHQTDHERGFEANRRTSALGDSRARRGAAETDIASPGDPEIAAVDGYAHQRRGWQCHRPGGKTRPQAVIRHKNPFPEQPRTRHRGIDPRRNGARWTVHRKAHQTADP